MTLASSVVGPVIRYHGYALHWVLIHFAVGNLLRHGWVSLLGYRLFSYSFGDTAAQVREYHKLSGALLAALACFLVCCKLYLLLFTLARPKIQNGFVAAVVKFHFLGMGPLFLMQYLGQEFPNQVAATLGLPMSTVLWLHGVLAQVLVFYALFLASVGAYLNGAYGNFNPSPKPEQWPKKQQ